MGRTGTITPCRAVSFFHVQTIPTSRFSDAFFHAELVHIASLIPRSEDGTLAKDWVGRHGDSVIFVIATWEVTNASGSSIVG